MEQPGKGKLRMARRSRIHRIGERMPSFNWGALKDAPPPLEVRAKARSKIPRVAKRDLIRFRDGSALTRNQLHSHSQHVRFARQPSAAAPTFKCNRMCKLYQRALELVTLPCATRWKFLEHRTTRLFPISILMPKKKKNRMIKNKAAIRKPDNRSFLSGGDSCLDFCLGSQAQLNSSSRACPTEIASVPEVFSGSGNLTSLLI